LKSDKTFVQQGEPLVVQTIVTDLDGKAVANHEVKMQAALLQWKQVKVNGRKLKPKRRIVPCNPARTPSNVPSVRQTRHVSRQSDDS